MQEDVALQEEVKCVRSRKGAQHAHAIVDPKAPDQTCQSPPVRPVTDDPVLCLTETRSGEGRDP